MLLNEPNRNRILSFIHILILLLSIVLVVGISIDIFSENKVYTQSPYFEIQFWICICFLVCFFIELFLSKKKWKYFFSNLIFLIVSIPFLNVVSYFHLSVPEELTYVLRFVPLLRGGYALALVVRWFTKNKISSMFVVYLSLLMTAVYFSSLVFYSLEYSLNPLVKGYGDALWWACMNSITIGCNIIAVTTTGRVLSVLVGAIGMMMFPIFTVYVTNIITSNTKSDRDNKHDEQ